MPDGQVAITVNLPDPERIAPLLTPGSHVVIYDTFNPRNGAASTPCPTARSCVTGRQARSRHPGAVRRRQGASPSARALVKPADAAAAARALPHRPPSADAAAQSGALVTVALPPAEALRLVHAVQTGTLYCGLRGAKLTLDHKAFINDTTVVGK